MKCYQCRHPRRPVVQHLEDGMGGIIPLCHRHSTLDWQIEQLREALTALALAIPRAILETLSTRRKPR